ncbi:syntaxin-16 [Anaeramoeba ignava]|uniref:Syntaxin-16 n=1 Tax=Anaeramoeba ignava TaxID=1746090 RepID=A0A9Q0LJG1_ANAIG|nr:syntaxin-16 [Anaeramoeba ignava]
MATRNLTVIFFKLRDSFGAVYQQPFQIDKDPLIEMNEIQNGEFKPNTKDEISLSLPPRYVDTVEEVQFEISEIEKKLVTLEDLHGKQLTPDFEDDVDTEQNIEILTDKISRMFISCEKKIREIGPISSMKQKQLSSEEMMKRNMQISLATKLQELTAKFRKQQSFYLKELKSQEEKHKNYFPQTKTNLIEEPESQDDEVIINDKGFTNAQKLKVKTNMDIINEREQEIEKIARSINDLAEMFKELSILVIDQGTMIDRIDYNIEQVVEAVEEALQENEKANKYQKRSRLTLCIICMIVVVFAMVVVLIIRKS